jgi:serine/threonine protein kinase
MGPMAGTIPCPASSVWRRFCRVTHGGGDKGPTGDPMSPLPARVAHFRIVERLGQGGMGVVYRAEDEKLRRLVAIELLQDAGTEERRQRFLREARSAAAVTHPNVAVVHADRP